MLVSLFSGMECFADEIGLVCKAEVAPFAIFERSEGVNYEVSVNDGTYTVTDYFETTVRSGDFSGGNIHIEGLPLGRFILSVTSDTNTISSPFAVVPDIEERRDSSECDFSFSAMASHNYSSGDAEAAYAKTVKLAGVSYVREFCNGDEIKDESSQGGRRYRILLDEYAKNDIRVMLMMQRFPGGDKDTRMGYEDGHWLTRDMKKLYDNIVYLFRQHRGLIDAFEIENEIDVWGAGHYDGPDLYAAFLKTAAIAADSCDEDVLISTAGFSAKSAPINSGYINRVLSNGTAEYFDIYDLHHYQGQQGDLKISVYPSELDDYLPHTLENGITSKKLWLSEYGLALKYADGGYALSEEQQKLQARTAPTAFVQAQSAGVDKTFWFMHGYMREKQTDGTYNAYGTLDKNDCPEMVYSSISALTNALGNSEYKGIFTVSGDNVNAHYYADGKTQIGCLWAEDEEYVSFAVNPGNITLTDIMGNETQITPENGFVTLKVGPDIQYVRAENGFASSYISEKVKYDKAYKRSKLTNAQKVVMLPMFDESTKEVAVGTNGDTRNAQKHGYMLSTSTDNIVGLRIYNFNKESISGTVTAVPSDGWKVTGAAAQSVALEPMECKEITFTVLKDGTTNEKQCVPLMFEGEFGGEKASPAVSYIRTTLVTNNVYNADLSLSNVSYDGTAIRAEFSGDAKAAKLLVNGKTYDADIEGNAAVVELPLTDGTYSVGVSLFDKFNTAKYESSTVTVTGQSADGWIVTYDANGGGAAPAPQMAGADESITLSDERPYKTGAVFMGWSEEKVSDVARYNPGDTVEFNADTTLYAVWESGEEPARVDFARRTSGKAMINGFVDEAYGGENVTFVVFKASATPESITASDIVNIGETKIDYDGRYVIEFDAERAEDYRYVLNAGGKVVDSYIEETTMVYDWMDNKITIREKDGAVLVSVTTEKYIDDSTPATFITAMYNTEGSLADVRFVNADIERGTSRMGFTYKVPSDAAVTKVFLWCADGNIIPICSPGIYAGEAAGGSETFGE